MYSRMSIQIDTRTLYSKGLRDIIIQTWDAAVGGFQVTGEVFRTRMNEVAQFRNFVLALASSRADAIQKVEDAGRTTKEAVVVRDTAAEPQATVASFFHQDGFVDACTARVEGFELTELATFCTTSN